MTRRNDGTLRILSILCADSMEQENVMMSDDWSSVPVTPVTHSAPKRQTTQHVITTVTNLAPKA